MQVVVANTNFETVAVVDEFESLLWVDRYNKAGDFELYLSAHSPALNYLKQDYYCFLTESEYVMIIEGIEIRTDAENGDRAIVTGRSLESILDRRIIWKQTNIKNATLQNGIKKLVNENIISPEHSVRRISNFIFESTEDSYITSEKFTAQYTGDNLYTVVSEICESSGIGFKVTLNDSNQFVFKLYRGINRTYDQSIYPYVIFSPHFDNILNSDYLESNKPLKNVTLVLGEGEGNARKRKTVYTLESNPNGLIRRELFTDARDISSETEDGKLEDDEYEDLLVQRGKEKLAENTATKTFDGEVESTILFKYDRDFFMGDIIQIENEFGISGTARIVEFIRSQDKDGIKMYPTFEAIE